MLNKYKIRCETEKTYRYVIDSQEPTTCPFGDEHIVDTNNIVIVESDIPENSKDTYISYKTRQELATIQDIDDHLGSNPTDLVMSAYMHKTQARQGHIHILPSNFVAGKDLVDTVNPDKPNIFKSEGGVYGAGVEDTNQKLYGFLVGEYYGDTQSLMIYGNNTDEVTVYKGDITDGSITSLVSGNVGTSINMNNITLTDDNYLVVEITLSATTNIIYGGILTLA